MIRALLGVWVRRGNHFDFTLSNQVNVLRLFGLLEDHLVLSEVELLEASEYSLDVGLSIGAKCWHALEEQCFERFMVPAE